MAATMTAESELVYTSFPIEKVEQTADGNVMVWGKATDDSVDSDQQIVDPDFAAKAIDEWMATGPNVRVQHQAQRDPAGVGVSVERDGTAHWVKSRIIEPVAKQLVLGGALRAYSVGIARPTIMRDGVARGGRITDGQIVEISLVDRPANKNCGIQLVKAAKDGSAEWVGKVFGSDDVIAKMGGADVTVTLPQDVQVSFSPLDLAKIVGRKNGFIGKDVSFVHGGGVPVGSTPKCDEDEDELEKDVNFVHGGAVPGPSMPKEDGDAEVEKGKLTTESRNALPDSDFVFPGKRKYPIHNRSHARNALARASGKPEESAVRAAVARRYPGLPAKHDKKMAKKAAGVAQVALPDEVKKDKAACAGCGAVQNNKHAFCSECGAGMGGAMPLAKNHDFMCLKCGYKLDKGEKFCPDCGTPNPGHNPMADLKIPANKAADNTEGSRVADQPDGTVAVLDPVEKKMKPKKGKKGKPFGGNQAAPFGKDKDGDDDKDGAEKVDDAPVTRPKSARKGFGQTANPGAGVVGQDGIQSVPAHREPDGLAVEEFERDAGLPSSHDATKGLGGKTSEAIHVDTAAPGRRGRTKPKKGPGKKAVPTGEGIHALPGHRAAPEDQEFDREMNVKFDADPAGTTALRLKGLGMPADMGYAHDLTCPAFDWQTVSKAYPTGMSDFSADSWQQKALDAASSAPLAEAKAASQLGQAAFTIKSAAPNDVADIKNDLYKAFRDANPGPSSFPTPGHVAAQSFQRPKISEGRAAYSHQYEGPNSASVPGGSLAASSFGRGFLQDGRSEDSPANKSGAPYPSETGQLTNLNYSSVHKENLLQAFKAMHDHFDRVFPGVCPMNGAADGPAAHPLGAVKADEAAVTKKVSADGMSGKQRRKLEKKLTKKVMSGKMPLDQARIRMGKKPKTSPEPLNPQKAAEPETTKTAALSREDVAKAFAVELRKARRKDSRKIASLTKAVNALADQPDPSTQAFKGMAVNPLRTKSAGPAGVQATAEIAERTQLMMLQELEHQYRTTTDSGQREAAWNTILKMRGLPTGS